MQYLHEVRLKTPYLRRILNLILKNHFNVCIYIFIQFLHPLNNLLNLAMLQADTSYMKQSIERERQSCYVFNRSTCKLHGLMYVAVVTACQV